MAKRKGKSEHRIHDWQQRYHAGDEVEDLSARRQHVTRRGIKLREDTFASEDIESLPTAEGMVTATYRRGAGVRVEGRNLFCGIAKTFRAPEGASPLAVGDVVLVALARDAEGRTDLDKNRMDGLLLKREPRATLIVRPQPRSAKRREKYDEPPFEKVIAANMDVMLVVAATREPKLRLRLIERYLIAAQRGEVAPVLALNKIDLAEPDPDDVAYFERLDVRTLPVSAATGAGLDALRAALAGKRTVLVGASGVGKSTLINALVPGADVVTREVRAKDDRGRHTTAAAAVYDLPGGGLLVDTPGVRELGVPLRPQEVQWYFPELEQIARGCKFNNCTHTHEPECAVRDAAEDGRLNVHRYESYLNILQSVDENLGG